MKKTIIKLIARFVGNRCVTFDGSRVYYWNVPMIVIPMDALVHLQHGLEETFGNDSRKILYQIGKIQGRNGTNILLERYKVKLDRNDPSFFMEQTEFLGIGKIYKSEIDFDTLHYTIHNKVSPNANCYVSQFQSRKKPVCDYVRGLIAGGLEAVSKNITDTDINMEAVEVSCIAKGDPECVVLIKPTSEWQERIEKDEFDISIPELNFAREKETLTTLLRTPEKSVKPPETGLSDFLKKNVGPRPFIFEQNGEVTLLGYPSLITPMDIFMLLYYVLHTHFGDKTNNVFYQSGSYLGESFSRQMFSKFGLDTNHKIHQQLAFDQIGLFGFGRIELVKIDPKQGKFIFRVYNSPGNHFKGLIGPVKYPVDHFLAGMLKGIISFLYNKSVQVTEEKCVASGNQFCIFSS